MSRRKSVSIIRDVGVDPKFGSEIVQKFINVVMWRGKKNAARQIVYEALDLLSKKAGGDDKALRTLQKALDNVKPTIEVKARRVGGSVYQIPTEVEPRRANALAMRWLISCAATRGDKCMGLRLGYELLEAAEGKGNAVKKRADVHKMAESNRAFSHFSW
jgi:small subunit ribosomal protein S7